MVSFIDYFIHRIITIGKFKSVRKNIIMILNDHYSLLAMCSSKRVTSLLINFEDSLNRLFVASFRVLKLNGKLHLNYANLLFAIVCANDGDVIVMTELKCF